MASARFAEVAPDIVGPLSEKLYTYSIPSEMKLAPGSAVIVPFGARTVVAIVIRLLTELPDSIDFDAQAVREIRSVIEGHEIPQVLVQLFFWAAEEFLAPIGTFASAAMPPGIRSRLTTEYVLVPDAATEGLSAKQQEVLKLLSENNGRLHSNKLGAAKEGLRTAARSLVRAGLVEERVVLPVEKSARPKRLTLTSTETVDQFIEQMRSKRPAQVSCLIQLRAAGVGEFASAEIEQLTGCSSSIVGELIDSGLLIKARASKPTETSGTKTLTQEQSLAVEKLCDSIIKGDARRFNLFGVTGSGKTEVFMRAATQTLKLGKQVLYLVPEIALTPQVVALFRGRFGDAVAIMHSGMSALERLRQWRSIQRGESPIVVGARSAIFAPLSDLGLIIVDEEHESSYKQESTPRYHVRSLAEQRARLQAATLVLGSATPSVETYFRTELGEFELLTLTRRATNFELPEVQIVDLREDYKTGRPALLSEPLRNAIASTLERNEQVMLFLNRRAYAQALICRECGACPKCPNCSVALVFHQRVREVRCHHCGYKDRAPVTCSVCGGNKVRPFGVGTERVEEAVQAEYPNVVCARLDRDVAVRRGAAEDVLTRFRSGDVQVLVGTQMIAKGLDFPNVSLVGVVTADVGLSVPDFRSTERTFQLLTQVAGRSGRHKPGIVLIQTLQPNHPAILASVNHDYLTFYQSEIEDRRAAKYPPFVRIANIIATSENELSAQRAVSTLAQNYRTREGLTVAGPSDCPLARIAGRFRKHIVVKFSHQTPTKTLSLPPEFKPEKGVQVTVDIDPQSLI